jgi:DNA primase
LETARIEEVVQDFVTLKRRGTNLLGLCPFHSERTPSFNVSPSKNLFKCFGCGKGGDPVRFVMEHENMRFPEALRYLARKYRIHIEEIQPSPEVLVQQQEEESLYIVNEFARQYYQSQLLETDAGRSIGLSYFKERGFREETIRRFGLGFAPSEGDAFTQAALHAGYKVDYLQKLGLSTAQQRDFFRNRVLFTIFNLSGKPVAFAGRIMEKQSRAPKYINSPESDIYVKNKVLYGINFAQRAIRQADECILVEGYTDVLSLHQAGIEHVVASSGTSLTDGQLNLVKRLSNNLLILYDGDSAGTKAALRGLDMVLEKDMNVRVALLPEGEDPDSYVRKVGAAAFREFLQREATDFILFKSRLLLAEAKGDPVRKAGLVRNIVDSIARVPDPFKRSFFIQSCARLMELDEAILVTETNKTVQQLLAQRQREKDKSREGPMGVRTAGTGTSESTALPEPADTPAAHPAPAGDHAFQERDIVRILVSAGGTLYDPAEQLTVADFILHNIQEVLDDFDNPDYQSIVREAARMVQDGVRFSPQHFIRHPDKVIRDIAIDLLHSPWEYSPGWAERDLPLSFQKAPEHNFNEDSLRALMHFKLRKIIRLCEKNQQTLKEQPKDADPERTDILLQVQTRLIISRNQLARELGIHVLK